MTTPLPSRRPEATRPILLAGLVLAGVGLAFALLPDATDSTDATTNDVQTRPADTTEPLGIVSAAFVTVPPADEVFAGGAGPAAEAVAPTF